MRVNAVQQGVVALVVRENRDGCHLILFFEVLRNFWRVGTQSEKLWNT